MVPSMGPHRRSTKHNKMKLVRRQIRGQIYFQIQNQVLAQVRYQIWDQLNTTK